MAEPGLALTVVDLNAHVGAFLGYGWGAVAPYTDSAWDAHQSQNIVSCVSSGLRRFYQPDPAQPGASPYAWSFLKPVATLTLLDGRQTLPLPDDFGGLENQVTLQASSTNAWFPLDVVNEAYIRGLYTRTPAATGRPLYVAETPLKGVTPSRGQRFQLSVFPEPDADYQVQFQYYVLPDALTVNFPYHLGGAAHAETVLESCLAVAEERFDDERTVHREAYAQRLAASVGHDRQRRPQWLGYNGDRSDGRRGDWRRADASGWSPISVNGTVY